MKQKIKQLRTAKKAPQVIVVIAAVALIGILLMVFAHAATPVSSVEAENGTLTGNASIVNDNTTSGGQAVSFGGSGEATSSAFPGQSGNPVGYAAYGTLGTTPWPGGSFVSGTASSPKVYSNYVFTGTQTISGSYIKFVSCDFVGGTGGAASITGSNLTFTGDRFQSNSVENFNVSATGSNLTFSYDSVTPLAQYYTSPPGEVWPSAGAGQNTTAQTTDVNAINGNEGYEYGVNTGNGSGPITIDHSDLWGFGNAIVFYGSTAQMTITNNWIHDAANASPQSYHTDGPGYLNGAAGPSNVLIEGNTIASLGNTNGLAFQAATAGYDNIQIKGNFLSGFGYTVALGFPGSKRFTNSSFENNVYGTDIQPDWDSVYGAGWADSGVTAGGSTASNIWKCNTYEFRAGTTWKDGNNWSPQSSINGKYWLPSNAGEDASATDYEGNVSCP